MTYQREMVDAVRIVHAQRAGTLRESTDRMATREHPPRPSDARPDRTGNGTKDEVREEQLDRTVEDTFPASDPPSTIPDPSDDADHPRGSDEEP